MARFANLSGAYAANETRAVDLIPGQDDRVVGVLWADAAGTLLIEQGSDGTNYDLDDTVAVVVNTGVKVSIEVVGSYARAKFTAGASPTNVRCRLRFSSAGYRG